MNYLRSLLIYSLMLGGLGLYMASVTMTFTRRGIRHLYAALGSWAVALAGVFILLKPTTTLQIRVPFAILIGITVILGWRDYQRWRSERDEATSAVVPPPQSAGGTGMTEGR